MKGFWGKNKANKTDNTTPLVSGALSAKRSFAILCVFLAVLLCLICVLFSMQMCRHAEYQEKVLNQITVSSGLKADRGTIYDTNGNILATNITVWRIFISPVDIQKGKQKDGIPYDHIIAQGLAEILDVPYDTIYEKAGKKNRLDETIQKKVHEEETDAVMAFVAENNLSSMVHATASTMRYYPYGSLASHAIGFTGSDNQGLFGLEAFYDEELTGTDGKYLTAVDALGQAMPFDYSTLVPAIDGLHMVSTIDAFVQRQLEQQLEATLVASDAKNRVTGVVMNVKTGAILAMATAPSYNLNDPYTLDTYSLKELVNSIYDPNSPEFAKLRSELLYEMWNNKAVSELYEPGSTFKIITAAMGYDLGVITPSCTFSCPGYHEVGGWNISCHKKTGHGMGITFAYGLQQSCNPTMMQAVEKIGATNFYNYFEAFGYLEKTGIDLPSEAVGFFHKPDALGPTELATSSFGQRFKVSIIEQLTAVATVANGGYSVTPHFLHSFIDGEGKVVHAYGEPERKQVLSASAAATVSEILEGGVSGDGGAKNAFVEGYKIAAKTGTSEKFDVLNSSGQSYLRVGSCVAYAPYDNAEIATIIVVDEPSAGSVYGSVVAAPYISKLLASTLPYLGFEAEKPADISHEVNVPSLFGYSVASAKTAVQSLGLAFEIIGEGDMVTAQTPLAGNILSTEHGKIILYTENSDMLEVTVPDVIGKPPLLANQILLGKGLNIQFTGLKDDYIDAGAVVLSQSIDPGTKVKKGSVITLHMITVDVTD